MTHYFVTGNRVDVHPSDAMQVLDYLPAATYTVRKDPMSGQLFLQTTNNFELPSKIYGDPITRVERIVKTFHERTRSTGVLLTGDKGSGKTLLSKCIANKMIADGHPVIVVNEPWCGEMFNELIGKINQPAMVLFDEFDKVYDEDDQKILLTLLDGTVETKKLFCLTTNSREIDTHLINRPGRIYYTYNYDGIEESFIRGYAADVLKNTDQIDMLVQVCNSFNTMTFDMVQAIIEEMNRFGESPIEVLNHLNVDITAESASYKISLLYNGKPVDNTYYPYTISYNPLFSEHKCDIEIYPNSKHVIKETRKELPAIILSNENLLSVSAGGVMSFGFKLKTENDLIVVLEKQKRASYNWGGAF